MPWGGDAGEQSVLSPASQMQCSEWQGRGKNSLLKGELSWYYRLGVPWLYPCHNQCFQPGSTSHIRPKRISKVGINTHWRSQSNLQPLASSDPSTSCDSTISSLKVGKPKHEQEKLQDEQALLCTVEKGAPFDAACIPSLQGLHAVVLLLLQELLLPLTPRSFQQLLQQLCAFLLCSFSLLGQGYKKGHFFILHPSVLPSARSEWKNHFPLLCLFCKWVKRNEVKGFLALYVIKMEVFSWESQFWIF